MIILGIESTHDDSALAIVKDYKVIINLKISQIDIFRKYGGTIPELASREHVNNFFILIEELKKIYDLNKIDQIAYSAYPGLIGSLHIGFLVANALALSLNKPIVPINHLHGHIYSSLLFENELEIKKIKYPYLALVLSGGHSQIYFCKNEKEDEILIGQSCDDAIGEAFDKVARFLDLGFPGGPIIDLLFEKNKNAEYLKFTKAKTLNEFDFSFSGYKSQVINKAKKELNKNLLAISFQKSTIDYVIEKFKNGIKKFNPQTIILAGGVSANTYLRSRFLALHKNALIPKMKFTTDNGAMIAAAAFIQKNKKTN